MFISVDIQKLEVHKLRSFHYQHHYSVWVGMRNSSKEEADALRSPGSSALVFCRHPDGQDCSSGGREDRAAPGVSHPSCHHPGASRVSGSLGTTNEHIPGLPFCRSSHDTGGQAVRTKPIPVKANEPCTPPTAPHTRFTPSSHYPAP